METQTYPRQQQQHQQHQHQQQKQHYRDWQAESPAEQQISWCTNGRWQT
jgi:hypothetical protein